MNIVIAFDSFKGCMSSYEAGKSAENGIKRVYPDAIVDICRIADGGEGTIAAIMAEKSCDIQRIDAYNPVMKRISCEYGILRDNDNTALIEMAAVSGITLLEEKEKNPLFTSSYGLGEVIADAIGRGCRKFIIGIGGSATNDGGVGMLRALGFEFLSKDNKEISYGALGLSELYSVNKENTIKELENCSFCIAADVTNPLCGENGCSHVYGPQKGADEKMVVDMDKWLKNYAEVIKKYYPEADENYPGAGAAGGMGFAFKTFLNADIVSGAEVIFNEINIDERIKKADYVITGEGKIDNQTVMGKAPDKIAGKAKKYGKKVIAFGGSVDIDYSKINDSGFDAVFSINQKLITYQEAMNKKIAQKNMEDTMEQVFRLIRASEK